MKETAFDQYAPQVIQTLPKGAFLTVSHGGRDNVMTIGWGTVGVIWGQPIFSVLVRPSRFTFGLLEASGEFTVSVPRTDMARALAVCGSKSGRDFDKFAAAGLEKLPGVKVGAPMVAGAGLHYECKVVFQQPMNPEPLDSALKDAFYGNGDFHTLYFGKILATWQE